MNMKRALSHLVLLFVIVSFSAPYVFFLLMQVHGDLNLRIAYSANSQISKITGRYLFSYITDSDHADSDIVEVFAEESPRKHVPGDEAPYRIVVRLASTPPEGHTTAIEINNTGRSIMPYYSKMIGQSSDTIPPRALTIAIVQDSAVQKRLTYKAENRHVPEK